MNRLAGESSPYLRQHADNPVHWYPWGEDAFAAARATDRPIFLSVGYSSCHWCHVMAHESFESDDTAAAMNRWFVNVKVDREERPDVDAIYMEATQAITGRGGWPMSVWLTPDGRPFYAGTYFPPSDRPGMPSFLRVCAAVADAWNERRGDIDEQAARLSGSIGRRLPVGESELSAELLTTARDALFTQFDSTWGGFGSAPKFPPAQTLLFLGRQYVRDRSPDTLAMVTTTLDAIAAGGIYDHVGGGFARYSVDERWTVPHFEKMLYDNALLVRAYTMGFRLVARPRYREVVSETLDYVARDLSHPLGGCFSAEDADSEGVEGKFYVWSQTEFRDVCGAAADLAVDHFGVTEAGNFVDPHTGHSGNVLRRSLPDRPDDPVIAAARRALFARRATRTRPGLDDKVLTSWNALMARAFVEAGWVFDRPDWIERGRDIVEFARARLRRPDGRWLRSWQSDSGPARHLGYCEDYAALLEAALTLAEFDDFEWIHLARELADTMVELFADPDGGFFTTGQDAEPLVVRPQDFADNATPSDNSMAAVGLLRLAAMTGDDRYAQIARRGVLRCAPLIGRAPAAFGYALEAVERLVERPIEVVITGPRDSAERQGMERELAARLLPSSVVVLADQSSPATPLLEGRDPSKPAGYVCEAYACRFPSSTATELAAELDAALSARR